MKAVTAITQKDDRMSDALFAASIEMAKDIVSTNLWYNMNVKRVRLLFSFCMDYLRCQKECEGLHCDNDETVRTRWLTYYN